MPIYYSQQDSLFHLQSKKTSYLIRIVRGYPVHVYWGNKLNHAEGLSSLSTVYYNDILDRLPQEYPQFGTGDFREPAYQVLLEDGSRITELEYDNHRILRGKPRIQGLPSTYIEDEGEAETLEMELVDRYSGLTVILSYTVFTSHNVITRSVRFLNKGAKPLKLLRALSASVDLFDSDYEMVYLSGAWTREGQFRRRAVGEGSSVLDSKRGASSHQLNPFMALVRPETAEDCGDVYAFSLVYSGSFLAEVEVNQYESARVTIGIHPFDFEWRISPGDVFHTPEVVMVYTDRGLGDMSRTYHQLYRSRLCRGEHRDRPRPILVNNWEATYFNFNEASILDIAKVGAELGIELFVLDDGWFGKRDDDTTSLGDWVEDRAKLPGGLAGLARRVQEEGLQFGLWVEPEMVSPDSELYRKHPDWCLHVKDRRRTLARTQLVLDLSREDVRQYIIEVLSELFHSVPITYIKWDMNRNITEIGSPAIPPDQQGELAHRYMLGLYDILEKLTSQFPHILFENCASGGGRFDPGMLYYMPQTWSSDNTDAIDRLKIQYGLSLVYPISAIGAHVSNVPNHQVGRITPFHTRGQVAMSGNFGYELDLSKLSQEEKAAAREQVSIYKQIREFIQQGEFYRLKSPFEGNEAAWMFVAEDKSEAIVFYSKVLAESNAPRKRLKLKGLDAAARYEQVGNGTVFQGDVLLYGGFDLPTLKGDFQSLQLHFRKIDG